jgi:hypothetical protein
MLLLKLGGSWLLPPWDFPHLYVRVTLWITTAVHLDTPKSGLDPFFLMGDWCGPASDTE